MPTLLLTVEEAAAELRIARRRVFDLIREGELRSVLIGTSRRIRSADLAEYVASLDDRNHSAGRPKVFA
jgi:excisionase family DNA binding protein